MGRYLFPQSSPLIRLTTLAAVEFLLIAHIANAGWLFWAERRDIFWKINFFFYPFGLFMLLVVLIAIGSLAALVARLVGAARPFLRTKTFRLDAALVAAVTLAIAVVMVATKEGEVRLFFESLARFDRFSVFFVAGILNALACLTLALSRPRRQG